MIHPTLPRAASSVLRALLRTFPVVVVSGARRTGKTTLVRTTHPTRDWPYRSLDELDHRLRAQTDPYAFVELATPAVIDVQRAPGIVLAIKALVDRAIDPAPGQLVLTGSIDLLSDPHVADSLAGRAGYLRLGPLTRREQKAAPETGCWSALFDAPHAEWPELIRRRSGEPEDWRAAVRRGGLPQVVRAESDGERARVLLGYVDTYLERDLREQAQIADLHDFRRMMRGAALRTGNVLNVTELARDIAVPSTTVHRWLNLLETAFLLSRVESFARNRTSRLIKSPKLYWHDTALGLFLAQESEPRGAHLENLVLADLLVWRELLAPRPGVFHWRATNGREVDFVLERNNRVIAVEIKATARPVPDDWRNLRAFLAEYADESVGGLLLHSGGETFRAGDGIVAAPWWSVL